MTSPQAQGIVERAVLALQSFAADEQIVTRIDEAASCLVDTFRRSHSVISCGNGGSMSDAMHFAEELTGRYRGNRKALPAVAISDPGYLTCVANDFGYEAVFARFVEAHGRAGDVLVALSTSGRSPNVVSAARVARERGMHVIALTGRVASPLAEHATIELAVDAGGYADGVQQLHIVILHAVVELVERELFPENYGESR